MNRHVYYHIIIWFTIHANQNLHIFCNAFLQASTTTTTSNTFHKRSIRSYSTTPLSSTAKPKQKSSESPIGIIQQHQSSASSASSVILHEEESTSEKHQSCAPSPRHIALICDGNSRWSERQRKQNQSQSASASASEKRNQQSIKEEQSGHAKGASRVISLLKHVHTHHPQTRFVTIYGFSSENWSRPNHEINDIWRAMEDTADDVKEWAKRESLSIKLLGDLDDERIPFRLRKTLMALQAQCQRSLSRHARGKSDGGRQEHGQEQQEPLTICIAINYGGRNDIVNASKKLAQMIARGEIQADQVDNDMFGSLLSTAGVPDPDLVIRTGGEMRLSNFLIWNIAYAELYFTDVLWPDFDGDELDLALEWFQGRDRRFGGRYGEEGENEHKSENNDSL
jgi:undecaprenyl diphosphate synthase